MDLRDRIYELLDSLSSYKPTDKPAAMSADIFNALLSGTKEEAPGDPVVAALSPVRKDAVGGSGTDAGSMRAALEQLGAALGGRRGPSIG